MARSRAPWPEIHRGKRRDGNDKHKGDTKFANQVPIVNEGMATQGKTPLMVVFWVKMKRPGLIDTLRGRRLASSIFS